MRNYKNIKKNSRSKLKSWGIDPLILLIAIGIFIVLALVALLLVIVPKFLVLLVILICIVLIYMMIDATISYINL